jgi:hypothetical protein
MLNPDAGLPNRTRDDRSTIYRIHQQTLCGDCAAIERGCILVLWWTAAQVQARGFTACTRCHRSLIAGDPSPP